MAAVNKQCDLRSEDENLFDHVIFCTNVTYADGGFKSGQFHFPALGLNDFVSNVIPLYHFQNYQAKQSQIVIFNISPYSTNWQKHGNHSSHLQTPI